MLNNIEFLINIAKEFKLSGEVIEVKKYGSGQINDTYLLSTKAKNNMLYILQRINGEVFHRPEFVMSNRRLFEDHFNQKTQKAELCLPLKIPNIVQTRLHEDYYVDFQGATWRVMDFIDNSISYPQIQSVEHAREVGAALGYFHTLVSDLDLSSLKVAIPGYHKTPFYVQEYERALFSKTLQHNSLDTSYCAKFIDKRKAWSSVLETAKYDKKISVRPIHGDPKLDNILVDMNTYEVVSFIDLDTVGPGLIQTDIGDCLRSCCNPGGDTLKDLDNAHFNLDICQVTLQSYFSVARQILQYSDSLYLYYGIWLIAFELGLRFFTDHIMGNGYFKVDDNDENLLRALVLFKLTESIERQEKEIIKIIAGISDTNNKIGPN